MNELIKIKDMISKYGVSARTLRYYEDMGLIDSTRKDDYAYRLYDEAAVKRLEQILILRKLNISIKDIRRVFSTPSSNVVLEILDKKVNDIDDEVALLHELKEIVLAFIHQIKGADFSNDGDVKLLYEKAKDIEAQLINVDYNGNQSNVNRLMEVTNKLERKPEIIKRMPQFYGMFHVNDPVGAFELYQKAFGAEKLSVEIVPPDDHYIMMEVNNFRICVRPSADGHAPGGCCVNCGTNDELRRIFDVLSQDGGHGQFYDAHWTSLMAIVTDKYGVDWLLCD